MFSTKRDVTMARKMYSLLNAGDIALADRAFGTYVDLVFVQSQKAEAVFRKHQSRNSDQGRGKRLGADDHIVIWYKPQRCPKNLSPQEFDKLPESIKVREVRFFLPKKGFRTKVVIVVTTLLNPKVYTKTQLAQLYRLRWEVEVDLRHVKTTLGMEQLRGKTPSMVRKEIYVHLMAYNLLRNLMWSAGIIENVSPLRLSLQGARQHLNNFISELVHARVTKRQRLYRTLLKLIAQQLVPERPGRVEPRTRKRRPKSFPLMNKPRSVLQEQLTP